jgi:hypothetical protein
LARRDVGLLFEQAFHGVPSLDGDSSATYLGRATPAKEAQQIDGVEAKQLRGHCAEA